MNYRTLVVAGGVSLAAIAGACTTSTGLSAPRPFAFIDIRELPGTNGTGLGPYASAIFIKDRVTGVLPSSQLGESCTPPTAITIDDGSATSANSANLDPGSVLMTLKGTADTTTRSVSLTPSTVSGGLLRYVNQVVPPLSAGTDSVRINVGGQAGGFPAFSLTTWTVPHFVAQPVDDSIVGQGIRIQWTGLAPGAPTRMQISLQYSDGTVSNPNIEVRCIAIDDGDFTVPRQYLTDWQEAGVDASNRRHQAVLSRFNTVGGTVADGVVAIVTRIDTTIVK